MITIHSFYAIVEEYNSDTLSDWEQQAELIGRNLSDYTSAPLTGSSIPALVHTYLPKEVEMWKVVYSQERLRA